MLAYDNTISVILFTCYVHVQGGSMSFEDVKSFLQLVEVITDVEMALSMYSAAGASITASG